MSRAEGRLRRLLLFNLATDADDPILGFTSDWIGALAARIPHIDVVTMRAGRVDVPGNVAVYSVGKERGFGEPRRAVEFYRIAGRLLRRNRYEACFAHMMPLFALMAAPLLRPRRVPITLWYTHRAASPVLRLAHRVVDHVVTSAPDSFPLRSTKVIVTGHGIDTHHFVPGDPLAPPDPARITSVARISPIKRLEELLDAAAALRRLTEAPFSVQLVGPVEPTDEQYASDLRHRADRLGISDLVAFCGPVSRAELPELYSRSIAVVNLSPAGLFDKAALEAMSCAVPVATSNPSMRPLLAEAGAEWLLMDGGTPARAQSLGTILGLEPAERAALGARLRAVVVARHSLDRLARLLVDEVLVS